MIVAGSVQLTGRRVQLDEAPAPKLSRDYECANAKLSTTLGIVPRRSVLESVTEMLEKLEGVQPAQLTDPHHYNIRWLELLCEVRPALDSFPAVL